LKDSMGIAKAYYNKGVLLSGATLEELLSAKGLDELVLRLKGTVYSPYVSKLRPPYDSKSLELLFREHLADLHHWLSVKTGDEVLSALYLKYLASDLKAVIKGKALGKGEEEILKNLDMHAEELAGRRDLIAKAVAAKGVEGAIAALKGSEFGDVIERAIESYRTTGKFCLIDLYLDHSLYKRLNSAFKGDRRVRPFVAYEIDRYNVKVILRGKLWNMEESEMESLLILPGFDLKANSLKAMVGMGLQEAYDYLRSTPYAKIVPEGKADELHIARLEDGFDLLGYRYANRCFVWEPFEPVVMIGIVKLKELEVRNLTTIAFGVEQGIPPDEIRRGLILLE